MFHNPSHFTGIYKDNEKVDTGKEENVSAANNDTVHQQEDKFSPLLLIPKILVSLMRGRVF